MASWIVEIVKSKHLDISANDGAVNMKYLIIYVISNQLICVLIEATVYGQEWVVFLIVATVYGEQSVMSVDCSDCILWTVNYVCCL